jgi:hypothetical protein
MNRSGGVRSIQDDRGARRVAVELDAWFEETSADPRILRCRTIDLSETGVRLTVPFVPSVTRGVLAFNMPDDTIVVEVEVVHTDSENVMGMRFVDLNAKRLHEVVSALRHRRLRCV